ncbi:MAG TPA: hypothetical protein VMB21_10930 [Candidatus Limnocylindria bacterium]|jgi:hypothetical protein|nr:hypothetical protein [Candidatus Limnocylindria bacterium]
MRIHRPIGLLLLTAVLFGTGCKPSPPAYETRWRFVGGTTLTLQTNAPALHDALTLPESMALRGPLLTNAARVLWQLASGSSNAPAEALAAAQPLVADLADRLSIGETMVPAGGGREFALALQGDAAHAQTWQAAWPKFFSAAQAARGGTAGKPQVAFLSGWIVAVSDSALITPEAVLKSLAQIPAEPQVVLYVDEKIPGWPAGVFSASVRDGAVRSKLKLTLADALPAKLPAWKLPPFIRDPLVQFAAARGIAPWLETLPTLGPVFQASPPSQLFLWGYSDVSLQTYVAALSDNPEKLVNRVHDELKDVFQPGQLLGRLEYEPEPPALAITGLPAAFPVLNAPHTNEAAYAMLSIFPPKRLMTPPPKELLDQLQRDNLLYYDWEISAAAVPHWNAFRQLNQIVHLRPLNGRLPGQKWLTTLTPRLGNCATEALVTGEHELSFTRSSSIGLSSLELTEFVWWLDAPNLVRPARPPAKNRGTAGSPKPRATQPLPHK